MIERRKRRVRRGNRCRKANGQFKKRHPGGRKAFKRGGPCRKKVRRARRTVRRTTRKVARRPRSMKGKLALKFRGKTVGYCLRGKGGRPKKCRLFAKR